MKLHRPFPHRLLVLIPGRVDFVDPSPRLRGRLLNHFSGPEALKELRSLSATGWGAPRATRNVAVLAEYLCVGITPCPAPSSWGGIPGRSGVKGGGHTRGKAFLSLTVHLSRRFSVSGYPCEGFSLSLSTPCRRFSLSPPESTSRAGHVEAPWRTAKAFQKADSLLLGPPAPMARKMEEVERGLRLRQ